MEGGVFVEGFSLDSLDPDVQDFATRSEDRERTTPSLFAAQAYKA